MVNKLLSHQNTTLKFPIYLTVFYLVLTLIIYILCPYDWPTQNPLLFYSLNILYICAIYIGYQFGLKREIRFRWIAWTEDKTDKLMLLISILTAVNFFMYLVNVFRTYGFTTFDFKGLFEAMSIGLKQPAMGYYLNLVRAEQLDGTHVMGGTAFTLLNLLWGFFKNAVAILSMLYFKKLKIYGKIFAIAYLLLVVVFYLSIGTSIQIFHVFLLLELPIIMETFDFWYRKELTGKKVLKLVVCLITGLLLVGAYFGYMMESRSSLYGYEIPEYSIGGITPGVIKPPATEPPATEPPVTEPLETPPGGQLPPALQKLNSLWISFSSYLTQGYYGMSQALTLDWIPMYGVGNSMFLVNIISENIYDIDQFTYQVRLEPYGWDSDTNWHTMYTWLANDVSFYGVVLVMFAIGIIFGMMFKDAVITKNPFARASVFFYILMLVFIPCNNQIAQSNENLCAFLLLIGLWMICGRNPLQSDTAKKEW